MARFDPYEDEGAYTPSPIARRLGETADRYRETAAETEAPVAGVMRRISDASAQRAAEMDTGADLAVDPATNEIIIAGGRRIPNTPQNFAELAKVIREGKLPRLGAVPKGALGRSFDDLEGIYDRTPEESSFLRNLGASGAESISMAWQGLEALASDDESELSDNWLDEKAKALRDGRSLGQIKAGESGWTGSKAGFVSELGDVAGNVAGNALMAAPAIIAGGALGSGAPGAGTAAGAVTGAGFALTGAAGAGGDAASSFREQAIPALKALSDEELAQLPMYEDIVLRNPGIDRAGIERAMVNRGSKLAALTATIPGALESVLGAKIVGRAAKTLGVDTALSRIPGVGGASKAAQAALERTGLLGRVGRTAGRAGVLGTFGGLQEAAETSIGISEGNRAIGVGSTDYLGNANEEDFSGGFFQSALFGLLPGGNRRSERGGSEVDDAVDDITAQAQSQAAIDAATDPATAAKSGPIGAALSPDGSPEVSKPERAVIREDLVPAELRGFSQANTDRQRAMAAARAQQDTQREAAAAQMSAEEQERTLAQLHSLVAERFGPEWTVDEVMASPGGRGLLSQIMQIERLRGQERLGTAADSAGLAPPSAPGTPRLRGAPFGDEGLTLDGGPPPAAPPPAAPPRREVDPQQGTLPGLPTGAEPGYNAAVRGPDAPLTLAERRAAQQAAQEGRAAASADNPPRLEQSRRSWLEHRLQQLQEDIRVLTEQSAQLERGSEARADREGAVNYAKADLRDVEAELAELAAQQQAVEFVEPPGTAPGGREPGTSNPVVLADGEPTPEEQAARAATQAQRGATDLAPAVVAPAPNAPPAPVQAVPAGKGAKAKATSKAKAEAVPPKAPPKSPPPPPAPPATPRGGKGAAAAATSKGKAARPAGLPTPEPSGDIKAQVAVLGDPNAGRRAVLVQAENAGDIPKRLPKGVLRYKGPNGQILLTAVKDAGEAFRAGKLNDTVLGKLTEDAVQTKAEVATKPAPAVVQKLDAKGNVISEQVVEQGRVREALAASERNTGGKGATNVTTPANAQARRAKAVETSKAKGAQKAAAKAAPPKKPQVKTSKPNKMQTARESESERKTSASPTAPVGKTLEPLSLGLGQQALAAADAAGVPVNESFGMVELEPDDYRAAVDSGDKAKIAAFDRVLHLLDEALKAAEKAFLQRLNVAENIIVDQYRDTSRGQQDSVLLTTPLLEREALGILDALDGHPLEREIRETLKHAGVESSLLDTKTGRAVAARSMVASLGSSGLLRAIARDGTAFVRATSQAQTAAIKSPPEMNEKRQPHVTTFGGISPKVAGLVQKWVSHFETNGLKFDGPVTVVTRAEYDAMRGEESGDGTMGSHLSRWSRRPRDGAEGFNTVIMLDEGGFTSEPEMIEALAHELGHGVLEQLYQRASDHTRRLINRAYANWLKTNQGLNTAELYFNELTPALQDYSYGMADSAYVRSFHEWGARNIARYLLDPKRPARGLVEQFFAKAADIMRRMWHAVSGSQAPDATLAEILDRWVDGTLEMAYTMPSFENARDLPGYAPPPGSGYALRLDTAKAKAGDKMIEDFEKASGTKLGDRTVDRKTRVVEAAKAVFNRDYDSALQTFGRSKFAERARKLWHAFMTRADLVTALERLVGKDIAAPVTKWNELVSKREQYAHKQLEKAEAAVGQVNAMTQKSRDLLNTIMYKATRYGIHPDKPWDHEDNKHLSEGHADIVAENKLRYEDLQVLWRLAQRANPQVIESYTHLRDINDQFHEDRYKGRLERINASRMSDANKELFRKEAKEAYDRSLRGPYFSLKRRGNWVVKITLPSHVVGKGGKRDGEAFETKAAAQAEQRRIKGLSPGASVRVEKFEDEGYMVRVYQRAVRFYDSENDARDPRNRKLLEDEVRAEFKRLGDDLDHFNDQLESFDDGDNAGLVSSAISEPFPTRDSYTSGKAMGATFSARLREAVDNGEVSKSVADVLARLEFESLPENNFSKSFLPRENIIGADPDMVGSFASNVHGAATDLADIRFGGEIDRAWKEAADLKTKHSHANEILQALDKQQEQYAERMREGWYKTLAGNFSKANSIYSLGFSVPYAVTNMTQPWLVAVPTLAAKENLRTGKAVGMRTAARYMKQAYADTFDFFSRKGLEDTKKEWAALRGKGTGEYTDADFTEELVTRFAKGDPQLEAVMRDLQEQGLITQNFIGELQDAMSESWAGRKATALQRLSLAFPAQVEAINRIVTIKASVNLARGEHVLATGAPSDTELADFARDVVVQTQGNYARSNRAKVFNMPGFEQMLMFKPYVQMMYMHLARNAQKALQGRTPQERREGMRVLRNVLLSHFAVAGAAGMGPVAWAAKLALAATAFAFGDDDDDKWKDGDQLMQDLLEDLLGEGGANFVQYGLGGVAGVDLSNRINLPTPMDMRFTGGGTGDKQGATMLDETMLAALGPGYANLKRLVQGGEDLTNGDVRNAIGALPNAVRPMVRGIANATRGVVDRDGDTFIKPDDISLGDTAIQLVGGTPVHLSDKYRERSQVKGTMARIRQRREDLMRDARNGKDVREEIRAFNDTVPAGSGYRITRDALLRAAQAKAKRDAGEVAKDEAAVRKMIGR